MKKHTFKKFVSLAMAGVMTLALGSGAFATTVAENNTPVKSVNELAYMDLESASPELRDDILSARAQIVYSQSWTVNGAMSVVREDGTVETLPEFSDLFPGWDLSEISHFRDEQAKGHPTLAHSGAMATSSSDVIFHGNVELMPYDNTWNPDGFTQFNGTGDDVYAWARTLAPQLGGYCNIGFYNKSQDEDLGWMPGLEKGEQVSISTSKFYTYTVRASATSGGSKGWANMIVATDPNANPPLNG